MQHRSASYQHQAFRTLRTFFHWCVETGKLTDNPLRGFSMRAPKTLPTVPTDDELRAVLTSCPATLEGARNRALILVLADSALRAREVLHLLVEGTSLRSVTRLTGVHRTTAMKLMLRAGRACR